MRAEAAKLDGATNWQAFRFSTLPLLLPVILIVTLFKTIFSLKMFDQVVTMTGGESGRSTQTLTFSVYQVGFKNVDVGYAYQSSHSSLWQRLTMGDVK